MMNFRLFLSSNISTEGNFLLFFINFLFFFEFIASITVFFVCGWLMTGCSIFVVAFFVVKNAPLIFQKAWDDNEKKTKVEKKYLKRFLGFLRKCLKSIYLLFHEIEVIYYISYAALTVLGTTVHPFFFAFHLTEILMRFFFLLNFF